MLRRSGQADAGSIARAPRGSWFAIKSSGTLTELPAGSDDLSAL
jgi:hypothetical protein